MEPITRKERTAYQNGPKVSVRSVKDQGTSDNIDDLTFPAFDDVDISDVTEPLGGDTYDEAGNMAFLGDNAPAPEDVEAAEEEADKMTDEEIKVKALNQAIAVAKLMSDVTTDDVLTIAGKLAKFIKG